MIGKILGIVSGGVKIAESFAARAERGQLIDAGEAQGLAASLKEVHEKLHTFMVAATRFDTDADFSRFVRDEFTRDD